MSVLNIHLLGDFRLAVDDKPITTVVQARQQALLAYLMLHRHTPQSRQHLAFLFWPDASETQARTNSDLLPAPLLREDGNSQTLLWPTVQISPSAVVTIHFGIVPTQTVGTYTNTATVMVTPTLDGPRTIRLHEQIDVSLDPTKNTIISVTDALVFSPKVPNGPWQIALPKNNPSSTPVSVEIISTPICVQPACGPLTRFYALHDGKTFEMSLVNGTTDRYRTVIPAGEFSIYERIYLVPVFETAIGQNRETATIQAGGRCERVGLNYSVYVIFDPIDGVTPCNPITDEPYFYDPSGFITDAQDDTPVVGATITLYRLPGGRPDGRNTFNDCRTVDTRPNNTWAGLPLATDGLGWMEDPLFFPAALDPAINPLKSDSTGHYGWDVIRGCWYIKVEAPGYLTQYSPVVGVPPEVTDLNIALERAPEQPQQSIYLPVVIR